MDTPVWSLALRRKPRSLNMKDIKVRSVFSELVADGRVVIIGPIRQELLSGIREQTKFTELRDALRPFPDLVLSSEDFERAAEMSNACRTHGIATTPVDMLICSVAHATDSFIFSTDPDFVSYSRWLPVRLLAFSTS